MDTLINIRVPQKAESSLIMSATISLSRMARLYSMDLAVWKIIHLAQAVRWSQYILYKLTETNEIFSKIGLET